MGCDGGTIPKRDELVRMKKKPEQVDELFYFFFLPDSITVHFPFSDHSDGDSVS